MAGSDHPVTFYFGLGSRYSYLAVTQIDHLVAETKAEFIWRPLLSTRLAACHDNAPLVWDDSSQDWSGAKVSGQYRETYRRQDFRRWADFYDVPYQEPLAPIVDAEKRTFYCVAAAMLGAGRAYSQLMFEAIYVKGYAIDADHCRSFARAVNLEPNQLDDLINSGAAEKTHNNWIEVARHQGVFGVPTFVYKNDAFWGNDRLPLLASALTSLPRV